MAEIEPQKVEVVVEETPVAPAIDPVEIVNRPRSVYGGMWGPMEIATVAVAGLALLGSLMMYFLFVLPSSRELARNRSEADRLEAEVSSARSKFGDMANAQDGVNRVVASVDDFETRFLPAVTNGQASLYQRLNGLIAAYGLTNTSGPDYAPLEIADENSKQGEGETGRGKFRSLYPGVYVSTTLEGSYQNLRRFIKELETGNEFVLISTIELAPSDNDGKKKKDESGSKVPPAMAAGNPTTSMPVTAPPGRPFIGTDGRPVAQPQFQTAQPYGSQSTVKPKPGKNRGEVVSLHIELAAYFRRPNFSPSLPVISR
jgi:hypothetical protein